MILTWLVLLERQRQAYADIAAAGDDDAPHRVFEPAHFAHEHADVLAGGDEEDLVAFLDDGVALGQHRLAVAIDCRDACLGVRYVVLKCRDALADEQAVAVRAHADQPHPAVGEVQHLRGTRIQDQLLDVLADQLLRADAHVDRHRVLGKQAFRDHVVGGADARDLGWRVKQRVGDLAGDHVGFVAVGQRDDDIGIVGAGAAQDVGVRGVADDGADIEPVLQFAQHVRPGVDDGDFVGLFAGQVIGRG